MFEKPFVRPKELSEALGVSTNTLRVWRATNVLPEPIQLGPRAIGWDRAVLNRWLASKTKQRCNDE